MNPHHIFICTDVLIEIRKNDMVEWEEKAEYFKLEYLKVEKP